MLNEYNGAITFLLQMNILPAAEDVASWIKDRSALTTYEFEEEKIGVTLEERNKDPVASRSSIRRY